MYKMAVSIKTQPVVGEREENFSVKCKSLLVLFPATYKIEVSTSFLMVILYFLAETLCYNTLLHKSSRLFSNNAEFPVLRFTSSFLEIHYFRNRLKQERTVSKDTGRGHIRKRNCHIVLSIDLAKKEAILVYMKEILRYIQFKI